MTVCISAFFSVISHFFCTRNTFLMMMLTRVVRRRTHQVELKFTRPDEKSWHCRTNLGSARSSAMPCAPLATAMHH